MKKLMIAAFAVAFAAVAQAATFNWTAETGKIYDGLGVDGKGTSAIGCLAYLIDANVMSQAQIVAAWDESKGVFDTSWAIAGSATSVNAAQQIGTTDDFTYGVTADFPTYFVVINDNNMFVSPEMTAEYSALPGAMQIQFTTSNTSPSKKIFDAADGYSTAGWYTAVPEPTSGLLMLLGMGALALRRRRA